MMLVFFIWIIMILIMLIQGVSIICFVKNGVNAKIDYLYSDEAISKARAVEKAIKTRKIKKHIIKDSAPIYDSKKTLLQYTNFLQSDLMQELILMKEENYNG